MYDLELVKDGAVLFVHEVRAVGSRIGRTTGNDLVLNDRMVSQHHALVWIENGEVWLKDLGSRNGTFLDGQRVGKATTVSEDARIGIGPDIELRLRQRDAEEVVLGRNLVVEDLASGVCLPISGDRFHIGAGQDCDLLVAAGAAREATLIVHENGEVWLGTDDGDRPITVGEDFEAADRRYALRIDTALHGTTGMPRESRYPYQLSATLNGATGPEATLVDTRSERSYKITSDNRAVLLFLLARQVVIDRESDLEASSRGWCQDDAMLTGIWGRAETQENKLHVLVHRVRKELEKAGFDPWFIEKRRRFIRARVDAVEIT